MISFLVTLGLIWIGLKILTAIVALPFHILGWILNMPLGAIFWIVLLYYLYRELRKRR
ncbi:MAG: hypothetical protein Q4B09_01765 [Lachnospiraceae bacterium]|nr:hypothetical protein [Lachnospiraceae bacterium]